MSCHLDGNRARAERWGVSPIWGGGHTQHKERARRIREEAVSDPASLWRVCAADVSRECSRHLLPGARSFNVRQSPTTPCDACQEEAVEVIRDRQELYSKDNQEVRQATELYRRMTFGEHQSSGRASSSR